MNIDNLQMILADAVNDSDLSCKEIPAIDLYLDQIVNLISDKNKEGSERFSDRVLTKTMINNYSKAGLISPVKGKKYSKEQIVQMLFTNSLKNVLSMSEIKKTIDLLVCCNKDGNVGLENYYEKYLGMKESNRQLCPQITVKLIEDNKYDIENNIDYLLAILGIVSLADYFKSIARAMLEAMSGSCANDGENAAQTADEQKEQKKKKQDKKAASKDEVSADENVSEVTSQSDEPDAPEAEKTDNKDQG